MEVTHLFSGNALGAVDGGGRVRLPPFILNEMARHGDRGRLLFGVHSSDPCLTGYGASLKSRLYAELERRRLRDEETGIAANDHHARARRLFGLVEEAPYDEAGRILLPPLARRRGGIGEAILFIGAGTHFELWDPATALGEGSPEVREVARYRLEAEGIQASEEEKGR
ncbi:MAG TPA: division/cell wall cluster transcriptional repressor MraZ [Allosphingosinicella sp.]|nr:division/cell wall cluster transcriptional repressor MraZ [Allosphingosinicella sp.]